MSTPAPDAIDIPARDHCGGTLRLRIQRERDGWPWAVELEYRYPDDDDPGDAMFLPLDVLGEIGTFVKTHCAEWERQRERAVLP